MRSALTGGGEIGDEIFVLHNSAMSKREQYYLTKIVLVLKWALAGDKANETYFGQAIVSKQKPIMARMSTPGMVDAVEGLYEECARSRKKCFGCVTSAECYSSNAGCIRSRGCKMIVSYEPTDTPSNLEFAVYARIRDSSDTYVAVGLSLQPKMVEDDGLKLLQGIGGDQEVFCRFTKDFTKQEGNFTNNPVHILLAAGYSSPEGIEYHVFRAAKKEAEVLINVTSRYEEEVEKYPRETLLDFHNAQPGKENRHGSSTLVDTSDTSGGRFEIPVERNDIQVEKPRIAGIRSEEALAESRTNFIQLFQNQVSEDIYNGCGTSKICFGCTDSDSCTWRDAGCINARSCSMVVSFQSGPQGGLSVRLQGTYSQDPGYVALGFSTDARMGGDAVIGCINQGGSVNISRSFNPSGEKTNVLLSASEETAGLQGESGSYSDGSIFCSFTLAPEISANGQIFNFTTTPYFPLLAVGPASSAGQLQYHSMRASSLDAVDFLKQEDPYESCGDTKKCIGCEGNLCVESDGCLRDRTCEMFLSFIPAKQDETSITITMMRREAGQSSYVAMGFSEDQLMEEQGDGLAEMSSSYRDGVLICTFTYDLVTKSALGGSLDLTNANLYLLLAKGETTSPDRETGLQYHANRGTSLSQFTFMDSSDSFTTPASPASTAVDSFASSFVTAPPTSTSSIEPVTTSKVTVNIFEHIVFLGHRSDLSQFLFE
ncbi:unnamed protein product [Darwinula stevensoni]|uniref:DOMON domain-containing protein n=1 Tax=Darwinula stevensoni TaxID=69355 RepID=A0A7R9A7P0_9CRUS|nr:unnamed protein product [Darwinula stevensoni]CAG0894267.1 unnamed protein product [Darwinula stevensoni]